MYIKRLPKKFLKSEKKWSPLIQRYAGMHKISTKERRLHAKHMEIIVYNLNNTIPHNVHLVEPFTGKFAYLHVYGHMNKYLLWHQLTLPQQLNCVCTKLAKQAVTLAMLEGSYNRPTQLLPKEDVAVVIWGNKITNDISHTIRFQASKEASRKYLGN